MSTETDDLETLERDYRERKAQIRADTSLSWEEKERTIRQLDLE